MKSSIPDVSLLMAAVMALWFGFVARHNGKGVVSWAVGGAILGLGLTGICLGLGNAVTIPYTHLIRVTEVARAAGVALGILGLIGAAFTVLTYKDRRTTT